MHAEAEDWSVKMSSQIQAKLVFLWTCSRSCSAVFERSIMTLASTSTKVISEPFQYAYYFGPQRQSTRYASRIVDPTITYEAIAKSIINRATGDGPEVVFMKDIGRFVKRKLGILEEFFHDAKHSFLIRDPKKAITSFYRLYLDPKVPDWQYFDASEAGFKELYDIYEFVKEKLDPNPVVIDADDLLSSPKEMMKAYRERVGIQYEDHVTSWKAGEVLKEWEGEMGVGWFHQAIHSNGFIKPRDSSSSDPEVTYPADVMKAIEENLPFYERLYPVRLTLVRLMTISTEFKLYDLLEAKTMVFLITRLTSFL